MVEYIPGGRDGSACDCCHGSSVSPPPPSPRSSPTFYSHWLPQAQNSETKAVEGRGRRRGQWRETEMSEGAGSFNVSGRRRVSVCRPLQALRRKEREAKRWGSVQPRAQSTRHVFIGSDLDGPLVSDLDGKASRMASIDFRYDHCK